MRSERKRLIGLGAKNPHTVKIVHAIQKIDPTLLFLGYLDNDQKKWRKSFFGYPVLGGIKDAGAFIRKGVYFCNFITQTTKVRKEITQELLSKKAKFTNVIHPSVDLEMVKVGSGIYIQENVAIQANSIIADNASIHFGSLVAHDCYVGNSVFIAHGCTISGEVHIEEGVFIGGGATILPKVRIGKWSIVGAGAVVLKDVAPYTVVVGVPAKVLRTLPHE